MSDYKRTGDTMRNASNLVVVFVSRCNQNLVIVLLVNLLLLYYIILILKRDVSLIKKELFYCLLFKFILSTKNYDKHKYTKIGNKNLFKEKI